MKERTSLSTNALGHLTIGGVDCIDLAKKYGTPLFVMDEDIIRENVNKYKEAISELNGSKGGVCYASKAFSVKEIYRIMKDEKIRVDCVSKGEIFTALSTEFPAQDIYFHGNNKNEDELVYAIENKVGKIVVDNLEEIEKIERICKEKDVVQNVLIRLKPGVEAHTHEYIRTGQIDSKFGFTIFDGEGLNAAKIIKSKSNIKLKGIHCHIGSQIFETEPFKIATEVMMDFCFNLKKELQIEIEELDMGGGFGVEYTKEDDSLPFYEYIKIISQVINTKAKQYNIDKPSLIVEPGRSIVAKSGITLYTAGTKKEIKGVRTYLSIDGGMTDNPRYALYKSKYSVIVANKANEKKTNMVTLAGKCCESGDLIGEDVEIQNVNEGDIIAVLDTGAYNYSMSSNYNRLPKPGVVMVRLGKDRLVVNKERLEDLIKLDL